MDMGGVENYRKDLEGTSLISELKEDESDRKDWVMSQYHSNMQNTGSFMLRQD
ncbi:MAG: hypothetical protein ACOC1O_01335 [bacterium]